MIKHRIVIFLLASFSVTMPVQADSLDLSLSNETVRVNYGRDYGGAILDFGALYTNELKVETTTIDEGAWLAHLGLVSGGAVYINSSTLEGGLGGRIYGGSADDTPDDIEVLALGLGGYARFFPQDGMLGFGIAGYYAPEIVTGLDVDRLWDFEARVEFKVFENASFYFGYRQVKARVDDTKFDIKIDDEFNGGVFLRF